MPRITHFECSRCGEKLSAGELPSVCPKDAGALWVRYDLSPLKGSSPQKSVDASRPGMWRYAAVLPEVSPVALGEGFTPMLRSRQHVNVWIKDEGLNPTGSFKARGLGLAVTMARAYGREKLSIPTAGNAGSALAAYAAAAGLEAHIFMPRDVPQANLLECRVYGAQVTLVDGLIGDCGRMVAERSRAEGWHDVSTLKEPFRVEGKKTMGYEVAEQLGWRLPGAIIYPTGGGVGLLGMWKAFEEMQPLGWIGKERPRMIAVQAAGCAPIVKAWEEGKDVSEPWPDAHTLAAGLRVPKAYGDYLILKILRESAGCAVAASDAEIMKALGSWAREEGIFAAPEGAASLAAYRKLLASGFLQSSDSVVLFNTGSGLKYLDVIAQALKPAGAEQPASRQVGGIIGPY
ncbi:MAG: threonine synthase [Acidobacteria bacterium]|nr:threonine synthase [Acidobacteriota bacterium]